MNTFGMEDEGTKLDQTDSDDTKQKPNKKMQGKKIAKTYRNSFATVACERMAKTPSWRGNGAGILPPWRGKQPARVRHIVAVARTGKVVEERGTAHPLRQNLPTEKNYENMQGVAYEL